MRTKLMGNPKLGNTIFKQGEALAKEGFLIFAKDRYLQAKTLGYFNKKKALTLAKKLRKKGLVREARRLESAA